MFDKSKINYDFFYTTDQDIWETFNTNFSNGTRFLENYKSELDSVFLLMKQKFHEHGYELNISYKEKTERIFFIIPTYKYKIYTLNISILS